MQKAACLTRQYVENNLSHELANLQSMVQEHVNKVKLTWHNNKVLVLDKAWSLFG